MKKVLIAAAMVALMASASFAAISLDVIGLTGAGNNVDQLSAAALSFGMTKDITLAIGAGTSSYTKPNGSLSRESLTVVYLNGYMTIMRKGDVSQALGLELGYGTAGYRNGDNPTSVLKLNGNYRVAVKVTPDLSMLFDVEVLAIRQTVEDPTSSNVSTSNVTILNGAKIGFSVPIF